MATGMGCVRRASICNALVFGCVSKQSMIARRLARATGARSFSSTIDASKSPLLTPDQVDSLLASNAVKLIDGSWHMPASGRFGQEDFLQGPRLPNAVFFDIDQACDKKSDLPHMLPDPDAFSAYASSLGLSSNDTLVVYDTVGMFSAPRVWWMFRYFGHDDVFVLNGGLPAWERASKELERTEKLDTAAVTPGSFVAKERKDMVIAIEDLDTLLKNKGTVLDARSTGRFTGTEPDPRGARPGHMPGALNVPFGDVLDEEGKMLPAEKLREMFSKLDLSSGSVTSCGSGVTACVVSLALFEAGYREPKHQVVYDGAWAEWGANDQYPVVRRD